MNDAILLGGALLAGSVLFIGGVVLLGFGGWMWARATAEVVRVRAHRNQADAEQFTMAEATRAVEDAHERAPGRERIPLSEAEIALAQMYETEVTRKNGESEGYTDTATNEGIEQKQAFEGGMYRQ